MTPPIFPKINRVMKILQIYKTMRSVIFTTPTIAFISTCISVRKLQVIASKVINKKVFGAAGEDKSRWQANIMSMMHSRIRYPCTCPLWHCRNLSSHSTIASQLALTPSVLTHSLPLPASSLTSQLANTCFRALVQLPYHAFYDNYCITS